MADGKLWPAGADALGELRAHVYSKATTDSEFRYGARPIPCLQGLDEGGRVICVGSFSKTLFPALRLGFLIVPSDLQRRLVSARRDADVHPPLLEQAALADLMSEGHPIATCGACAPHTASDWTHEHGTVRYLPQPFSQNRPPALTISSEFSRVCHRASAARQT